MKRLLIIGGSGQLGTALRAAYPGEMTCPGHTEFEIVTGDIEALLSRTEPDVVINCAAFHNVDRCEREPELAFQSNALAVGRFAEACARRGILFVTISTDYVFSGDADQSYTEVDSTVPRTTYGVSKLAGELLARRHPATSIVVRTSGVFGTTGTSSKGYTLIDRVLGQAERGETTQMVSDITFSPSYAPHVARVILDLVERKAVGTHHVVNGGHCTWYEFVRVAFEKAGLANAVLLPVGYASLGNSTPRPRHSPLRNTTLSALGITPLPSWEAALDSFLEVRAARLNASA